MSVKSFSISLKLVDFVKLKPVNIHKLCTIFVVKTIVI